MNEAEKKLMTLFTLIFVIFGGLLVCYELDKNQGLEKITKDDFRNNKIEKVLRKEVQEEENQLQNVERKTQTRSQTKNIENNRDNTRYTQNRIENNYQSNTNYAQNRIEKKTQEYNKQEFNDKRTILIAPNNCNIEISNPLKATYCNIGAYSKYSTNKEVVNGKYYFEAKVITNSGKIGFFSNIGILSDNSKYKYCNLSGHEQNGECKSTAVYESSHEKNIKNNDIIGIAFDLDKGLFFYSINGVWNEEPKKIKTIGVNYAPAVIADSDTSWELNFGERRFNYSMPIGYKAFGETTIYQRTEKLAPNKYNPNKITLIKPNFCRNVSNKTNYAQYCQIGAYSTYIANKKLNRGKYYYEAQLVTENNSSSPFNNIGLLSDLSNNHRCSITSKSSNGECNGVEILSWKERRELKNNDVIGILVDFDNNKINYSKNGITNNTPITFSYMQTGYSPAFEAGNNSTWIVNFGESNFKYTKPAGYNTLNKKEAL